MGRQRRVRLVKSFKSGAYVCPLCRTPVKWVCHGRKGWARCANNSASSRVYTRDTTLRVCEWEDSVRRRRDGSVELFYIEEIVDNVDDT